MITADLDLATAQAELQSCIVAKLKLARGELVEVIAYSIGGNNQRTYTRTNMRDLDATITYLRQQVALNQGKATRRPIYFRGM